jgi:hypothetical protein
MEDRDPNPSPAAPRPAESDPDVTVSQAERLAFVKFARYTALTADKLAASLTALTESLETAGVLDPARPSRSHRVHSLRQHVALVEKSDHAVAESIAKLPDHPDGEALVSSLLQGLDIPLLTLARSDKVESAEPSPP